MMINTPPLKLRFSWKLLCLALVVSEPAAALTLGELTIQSAVGQRFRGSVNYQLSPEDGLAEDCSKLSILAPNNDLPGLGQASLRLRSKERGGQILIQSADAVYEPMASFSIRMECKGQQLQRSYTVFLDPAPLTAPVVEETQTNIRPPATSTPSRARRSSATPVKAAAKTTESQTTTHSTHKAVEAPPPPPIGNGQLRIESELSIKNQPPAVLSPEELKTKIAMMQSLQEQLQSEMIRLQQSMLHLQALSGASAPASGVNPKPTAAAAATLNISTMDTPAPSEAPEPIAPKRVKVDEAPGNSWWMAAVLAALAAAAGAGLWLRRRQAQNTWDSDAESLLSQVSHTAVKVIKPTDAMEEHSLFRHSQLFYGGIEVQEEEDGSATLERAQLLVAQGETDQAIELLYQTIDENEADNEPWLLLFRVLRQQGMKTEYAQLARRFHDLEGDADDWALVRNIGYRLDPDNPLYSAHAIEEISPEEPASPVEEEVITAEAAVVAEPLSGQDAMLMEFLSTPAEIEPEAKPIVSAPQVISLDLPPLEFSPPDEENSALDISLLDEEETIEASLPLEEAEPIEEIDLVELEIELQPPLSVFEPRKH
jgi:pilus assembly protein FimV